MSQNQSKQPSVAELLEMSRTQIVAEAFLLDEDRNPKYLHPNKEKNEYTFKDVALVPKILKEGNNHTSKLTEPQIKEFMENWEVVAYLPNTTTGFSGTLFQAKRDIPGTTIKAGEKVMSLRSTEFIDDEVRDSQQTNTHEIAKKGWAFGQIDDLEQWFQGLRNEKLIGDDEQIRITGYSLGGHLATAFNILHRDEGLIKNTYTFNGAGVGRTGSDEEMDKDTLRAIIEDFHITRQPGYHDKNYNQYPGGFLLYYNEISKIIEKIPSSFGENENNIHGIIQELKSKNNDAHGHIIALFNNKSEESLKEQGLLWELYFATNNIITVLEENFRVQGLSSGGGKNATRVNNNDIAALSLDYQLAVEKSARYTKAYTIPSGVINALYDERNQAVHSIEGFYDIYAENPPSMVASSQLHYGQPIPIMVENQPLGRGKEYTTNVVNDTKKYHDLKLLVNNYSYNDFGDTHSIVLLTDSLEAIKSIDNIVGNYNAWSNLLKLSSNKKTLNDKSMLKISEKSNKEDSNDYIKDAMKLAIYAKRASVLTIVAMAVKYGLMEFIKGWRDDKIHEWDMDWVDNSPNGQGYADGDAIESLVNTLAKTFGVDSDLKGDPNGNTWYLTESHEGKDENGETHTFSGRTDLHNKLREVSKKIESYNLGDGVEFKPMDTAFASTLNTAMVRENFGYLVSLYTLSPFSLVSKGNSTALDKVWTDNWNKLYQQWKDDKAAYDKGQAATHFSDEWINDRIQLLTTKSFLNYHNINYNSDSENFTRDVYLAAMDDSKGIEEFDKLSKVEKMHYAHEELKKRFPYLGNFELVSVDDNMHVALKESLGKIVFGSEKDTNPLIGSDKDDHLYGTGENDVLIGGKGNDYMEGGAKHDIYKFFVSDNGVDTIFDSDGDGSLEIDGINLGKQTFSGIADPKSPKAGDAYYSEDKKYGMTYNGVNWEFSVQDAPGHYQALAHLRHWQNGQLGISLKHADDPDADPALVDFDLDHRNNRNYIVYDGKYAPNGIKVHGSNFAPSQFTGSGSADVIHTGDAVLHRVVTRNGGDTVKGGAGHEYINAGIDNPKAEDDNDTVYAGDNSDIVLGGAGRDEIWAGNEHEDYDTAVIDYKKYEGVTDPESLKIFEREKRGDWVHGQYGNDTIYGSAKEDILIGGEGFDTIRGGAGKDLILGDADYIPFATSPATMGRIIGYRWSADGTVPRRKEEGVISLPNGNVFSWQWKAIVKEKDSGNESWDFTISPGPGHTALLRNDRFQQLENGNWNDTIYGGEGDDIIFGQLGDDTIHGGDGDDVLHGDDFNPLPDNMPGGKDTLYGGAGNDRLFAGGGNATMNGGSGNDIYHSGKGNDTMTDESGDDVYWLSSGLDGVNDQGSGYDTYHIAFDGSMISGFTTISDADGKGSITYRGKVLTADQVQATGDNEWRTNDGTAKLTRMGSSLIITNTLEDFKGRIIFNGFFNTGESLGLKLPSLDDDNKPNPDPKTQPDPKPQPEQPQAPTAGKLLAAQSVHEKEKLTYTLAEDTFHTANKDDKLTYSARLADGKPLPGWLSFNPQTRTFSGTPGNDDVGMLNVEISAKGKGGSANQRFTLNVINVNDAPQAGQKLPTLQIEHSKLFYYQLPEDAFKDIDKNDKLTFSATSENGQSLPSWLKFDAYNGTFTGSPSANTPQGNYRVTVTVTDSGGLKAHQTLVLNLAQGTPLKPVNGTDRNDVLISSADNELLAGKGGKDVYQFSRGFGHDLINNHDENSNQDDVVTFTNMNRKDFVIMRDYTSLYLRSLSGTDELRIMGQFPANSKWRIGEIRFADGGILTADEIERELQKTTEGDDHIYGSKDNDIINGKGGNDVISGEEGDDELYGEDGNDNLIGSVGNDKLSGGAGEDSLNGGDGRDHLSGGAGNDELIGGEDDDQLYGNEGDDKLYGGTGNDLLIGDSGNDVLSGSAGNDIYRFARGFGHDVINNYDGGLGRHDSIDFSEMNRSDFDIRREGNNLVLRSKDGKDQITVTNHFFNGWQIDSIRFADGTTLDHGAINSAVSTQNAPRGNYMPPAAQALQMNQMIASLNSQAQPLHALAIPDEKQPLLSAVNPY